jgi:hypothetical protein
MADGDGTAVDVEPLLRNAEAVSPSSVVLPIGVRAVETMTASGIDGLPCNFDWTGSAVDRPFVFAVILAGGWIAGSSPGYTSAL